MEPSTSAAAQPMRLCYRHADTAATRGCERCRRPICGACSGVGPSLDNVCPPCATAERTRSARIIGAVVTVGVITVGGAVAYAVTAPPAITYSVENKLEIERTAARIANSPCDGNTTLKLTELLLKERDYRRILDSVSAFDAACKPVPRLWWDEYSAATQVQDFARAEAAATRLITDSPDDGDFYWWRGKARRDKGDVEGAIADMLQSASMHERAFFSVIDAAKLLEQVGRPCEAVPLLARVNHNQPDEAKKANIAARLHRLVQTPCPDPRVAMVQNGKVAPVCASLPKELIIGGDGGFNVSLANTWVARTQPIAKGEPSLCAASIEENTGSNVLGNMKSWSGRMSCAGKGSVTATRLHATRIGGEEEVIKKLVDEALRSWCTGGQ